jgi:perosamine synthetase
LQDIPGVGFQPVAPWAEVSPWMFSITVDPKRFGRGRDEVMAELAARGVDTRPMFLPLHQLPPFREQSRQRNESLPITDRLAAEGIMLPTYNQLTDADLQYIGDAIAEISKGNRRILRPFKHAPSAA